MAGIAKLSIWINAQRSSPKNVRWRRPRFFTMRLYKATLFSQGMEDKYCTPIDSCYISERSYPIAEDIFFNQRNHIRTDNLYVEVDEFPRDIETGNCDIN